MKHTQIYNTVHNKSHGMDGWILLSVKEERKTIIILQLTIKSQFIPNLMKILNPNVL
jgi:hypothetical protein